MSQCCPLFSGSSGNVTYVGCNNSHFLVDLGVSTKKCVEALKSIEVQPEQLNGIFITHEHIDHCKGIKVFTKKYSNIPIYATVGTIQALAELNYLAPNTITIPVGYDGIEVADSFIKPFPTSHDCRESVGYTFEFKDGKTLALATDLGYITDDVKNSILQKNLVIIESNHDIGMLQNCTYPYTLKRRIMSNNGHLSNDVCSNIIPELLNSGSTKFILAHLSKEANYPQLAYQSSLCQLKNAGAKLDVDYQLQVAKRDYNGDMPINF